MNEFVINVPNEKMSQQLAKKMAGCLTTPLVLGFCGDLGAGKTTFIRAMLRALGITGAIKSPTFSLIETYDAAIGFIHHMDLYRIQDESELEYLGIREYFTAEAICCIEWPQRMERLQDMIDLQIYLTIHGAGREIKIQSLSKKGAYILTRFLGDT